MQTDSSNVVTGSPSVNAVPEVSIEDAYVWLAKMAERGIIHETPARLAKSAISQLTSVLGPEESREPQWVLDNIEALGNRLCTRENADPETVKTYMGRAKAKLADYLQYKANPTAFKPRAGSIKGAKPKDEKKKKSVPIEPKSEAPSVAAAPTGLSPQPAHAQKSTAVGLQDVRHFPLGKDGRAIQFNIPGDGLNMREVAKFVCHLMTLADDFDPFNNPKHAAMFQMVKAEQTSQPNQ